MPESDTPSISTPQRTAVVASSGGNAGWFIAGALVVGMAAALWLVAGGADQEGAADGPSVTIANEAPASAAPADAAPAQAAPAEPAPAAEQPTAGN